jgi:hypothetical protein
MIADLALCLAAATSHEPATYPIEPVPLRLLVRHAELIAIAVPGPSNGPSEARRAKLTIEKVLKGDSSLRTVAVISNHSII